MPASAGCLVNSRVKSRELGRVQWGGYGRHNIPGADQLELGLDNALVVLSPTAEDGNIEVRISVGYELINNPLQLPHSLMYHCHNILTVNEEKIGAQSQFGKLDELDEGRHPYQEKEPLKPFPDNTNPATGEVGGPKGPEPTRYGDWERKGRVSDF
uniref:Succinate dehydrogenase assembly factor 4, mitochondrial n=1 Tax=Timema californicum TaxID=61474 RepID=A0A7R9PAD4_TIMCA|nr:unnamed protein product [Timema californicum]